MILDINNIPRRSFDRAFVTNDTEPARDIRARGRVPGRKLMPNYWVTLQDDERWLVLYFYGNDVMSDALTRRLIGSEPYTLAVRERDGLVAFASAETRKHRGRAATYLNLTAVSDRSSSSNLDDSRVYLPRTYRRRIAELASMKRPYCVMVSAESLLAFADREASYNDLQTSLTYTFRFNGVKLKYEYGDWSATRKVSR